MARSREEVLLAGEKRALELAMRGAPLGAILEELVRTIEAYADNGTIGSIQLIEGNRLRHGAAPNLPEGYNQRVEGLATGPNMGSCGTAAYTGEMVIADDIATDPRWSSFREVAAEYGLRSCWSSPIRSTDGVIVGTFAVYRREVTAGPSERDLDVIGLLNHTAALVIERDVEARHRRLAAGELRAAKEAAERANRSKDEFLAMLGHELRNPLAPIVTALHLMDLRGDDSTRSARAVIARQIDHVVRLVDDLLDVSRITSGRIALRNENLEIGEIISRAVEQTASLFQQKRNQLAFEVERGLAVAGDATRLAQVLANLLTNAAKYSDEGARTTLTARRDGESIVITVRDTGIGIAPELLPHVFELFTQADPGAGRTRGGLGLGLTIVRNLVEMHGGTVSAASEGPGHGSRFTIVLPAAQVLTGTKTPAAFRALGKAAFARKVLVVDDNTDIAEMMAESLSELGHDVRTAGDGPSAVQESLTFAPDVVLLDLGLPVMDGYEVATTIRGRVEARRPFLVAVTGYGRDSDRDRTMAAGFDAHLVKPVRLEALISILDTL